MNTPSPAPARKKLSPWWIIAGAGSLILLILLLFVFQLVGPSARIVVAKDTTHITAPLLENGLPDYEAYIRDKLREGITPENNAATLLFEALWPAELGPDEYEAVAAELGLDEIPSAEAALQPVPETLLQQYLDQSKRGDATLDAEAIVDLAYNRPWTSDHLPPLAAWLDANQRSLDLIVEASRRPRYYSPSPTLLNDEHDMLIEVLLPGAQAVRRGARALALRSLHHTGERRLDEAWDDALALYRLSALVAEGPTIVEKLVAISIRGIAGPPTMAILDHQQLTPELARQIQRDLAAVSPFAGMAHCINELERLGCLDAVVHMSLYGVSRLARVRNDRLETSPADYAAVDWNIVLRRMNDAYDEMVAAMRIADRTRRQQALDRFYDDVKANSTFADRPGRLVAAFFSRSARSDVVASIVATLMLPALDAALAAEDRANTLLALTQLASALAVHRVEHDAYPEKLQELVPGALNKLPLDPFGNPFVYKRFDDGYLLYSLGRNGLDDAGSNELLRIHEGHQLFNLLPGELDAPEIIAEGADDYSIRLPVRAMPPPPRPSDSP